MNILTIAYYTVKRYSRNIIAIFAFILAPILIISILTGSTEYKSYENINVQEIQSEISNIHIDKKDNNKSNLKAFLIDINKGTINKNLKISIACTLFFLFYGGLLMSYSIIDDLKSNVHIRIKSSSVSFIENFMGKFLGNILILIICAFIDVLIIKYGLNINWNGNYFIIFLSLILFLIIVNSIGIIITVFFKNIYICALIFFAFNYFMFFPIMVNAFNPNKSEIIDIMINLSFHNYVYKSILADISNNIILLQNSMTILIVITIILFSVSLIAGRRILR
ncbi:ABC-2 family transporter protein [Clostridium pasteurianum DSM 525 = ATCC 6013]|uniref:ABC-2 family transporter protein n=1 Tax=Clostridium pasteurianum DSM 525 = ATCC 6013 TaxID=1262449 RepID=A0A0H3J1A0_CLOPA|nr:ABC transporter permease [Clostridium pasteurianum]AJA46492.1 ABC-2 family transporter protein [Clostridium pasteurianum DSM 525 = ATCC 6013]AJA50480.1 ABC-2 family transporter protein [Clostridium pasteurianum DSM 525 = ATCC 6013]AOZ73919.1 hypothetical protein AQ983_01900 [Clostridium pasteurianum DSM 525 = ATCC 6013]AOZ77716.1 hypothetical protein AQ984_01900 [Clostridium pasteurianum]ELP61065.1 ABC transporter [Clostridium pasteurianum DSM 525 = ATCC 6013]